MLLTVDLCMQSMHGSNIHSRCQSHKLPILSPLSFIKCCWICAVGKGAQVVRTPSFPHTQSMCLCTLSRVYISLFPATKHFVDDYSPISHKPACTYQQLAGPTCPYCVIFVFKVIFSSGIMGLLLQITKDAVSKLRLVRQSQLHHHNRFSANQPEVFMTLMHACRTYEPWLRLSDAPTRDCRDCGCPLTPQFVILS